MQTDQLKDDNRHIHPDQRDGRLEHDLAEANAL